MMKTKKLFYNKVNEKYKKKYEVGYTGSVKNLNSQINNSINKLKIK